MMSSKLDIGKVQVATAVTFQLNSSEINELVDD